MKLIIFSYNIEGLTLEYNYCHDQSLKKYVIEKSNYLNKFLGETGADIICIQEYTPILNINLSNYGCIKMKPYAIFFRKNKFEYINHSLHNDFGLILKLSLNDFIFKVGTVRLPPLASGITQRNIIINNIDELCQDNIIIYAMDTNMKKNEDKLLNNLIDCFNDSLIKEGYYTFDKKYNPYFCNDVKKNTRTRYDKIFCTNIFNCDNFVVIKPQNTDKLIHDIYPYGAISDHYPIVAILSVE